MALEIERRFLLKNDKWKNFITQQSSIEQGYLSNTQDDWITRIRFNGETFKITLKKHIEDFTSFEFEYVIPNNDGERIMSELKNVITKERFLVEVEKHSWTIDCFKEKNFPLEIAEIELSKADEKLKLPNFVSEEITGNIMFSNFSLSTYPFSRWKQKDFTTLKNS